ncbi:MAG: hypothetical protein ACREJ9_06045 [Candidatus Rokuibacteriota bacterium]
MPVIARKVQGTAQDRIRTLVAEHLEMLEPGLSVLETSLRLGRTTIDVVAVDAKQTLVLVAVGEIADEKLLVSTLDAYVWCVAFPDNVRRLYPAASIAATRPPRVIFVAESMPDAFLELVERLSVVNVECQELSGLAGADRGQAAMDAAPAAPAVERQPAVLVTTASVARAIETPAKVVARPTPAEPVRVAAGFDSAVARQWESFLAAEPGAAGRNEMEPEPHAEPVSVADEALPRPAAAPVIMTNVRPTSDPDANGHGPTGHSVNGHANGRSNHAQEAPAPGTNTRAGRAAAKSQPSRAYVFAQLAREVEQMTEHAAVDLGRQPAQPVQEAPAPVAVKVPAAAEPALVAVPPALVAAPAAPVAVPETSAAVPEPPVAAPAAVAPVPARPASVATAPSEEKRPVNHPALESLRFPKNGVSRQWQEFLDQLAAEQ